MEKIRLQKYLSECGVLSRRAAEAEILSGSITVNGVTAQLGDKIDPDCDTVVFLALVDILGELRKLQ